MENEQAVSDETLRMHNEVLNKLDSIHIEVRMLKSKHSMLDGDLLLSFTQVCQYLNVSERQVRRYREENKLTGFMLGGRRFYRKSEVESFVLKMEKEAKEREMRSLGYLDL